MPGSLTSVFGEPDDFRAALSAEGAVDMLVTGRGQFLARLTRLSLHHMRLSAGEEELSRIVAVAVPPGRVLVSLAINGGSPPIWGGSETQPGEIITIAAGERVHARTIGPCRWGTIQILQQYLVLYGRTLTGACFEVPPGVARWRPSPAAGRHLHQLYRAAIRMAEARSKALACAEAAHGLEQQLLHALIECLSAGPVAEETPAARRHRDLLARFEVLNADPLRRMGDICAALGVSERLLRACCRTHLGMSPGSYRRCRGMQQVHRALCRGDPETTTVSAIARQYGFLDLGRFASLYRAIYGEAPSTTLRRRSSRGMSDLGLGPATHEISATGLLRSAQG